MVTKNLLGYNTAMKYYSYDAFKKDTQALVAQAKSFEPDVVVGIARGGVALAQMLAYGLNVRSLQTLQSELYDEDKKRDTIKIIENLHLEGKKKVLIADDIVDSGETLYEILHYLQAEYPECIFKTATLFYKPTAKVSADFRVQEATEWIEFFWERDYVD